MLRTLRVPAVVALSVLSASCARGAPWQTEILWDTWGRPAGDGHFVAVGGDTYVAAAEPTTSRPASTPAHSSSLW